MFIPNIVIVATTISILVIARRSARRFGESVQWRGALPVVLTAVVYCLASLPKFIVFFISSNFVQDSPSKFYVQCYRITAYLTLINIMSNFYIYALTISTFRGFLLSRISSFSQTLSNMTSSTG